MRIRFASNSVRSGPHQSPFGYGGDPDEGEPTLVGRRLRWPPRNRGILGLFTRIPGLVGCLRCRIAAAPRGVNGKIASLRRAHVI